jgi:hypothetical protein
VAVFFVRRKPLAATDAKAISPSLQIVWLQILPWNLKLLFANVRGKTGFNIRGELLARKYSEKNPRSFAVLGFRIGKSFTCG